MAVFFVKVSTMKQSTMKNKKLILPTIAVLIGSVVYSITPLTRAFALTVVPVTNDPSTCVRVGTCDDSRSTMLCKDGTTQLYIRGNGVTCGIIARGIFTPD